MRFLSNTTGAKCKRRFRLNQKKKGLCTRCPQSATIGFATCWDCRQQILRNKRKWLAK
jgi:hypothetical protein